MATKRGNIHENIRALIQGLASFKKAEVNSTRALHAVIKADMPYVNIYSDGEYSAPTSGLGSERQDWKLTTTIEILTQDGNIEELRGEIKELLAADITRGGNAINTIYEKDKTNLDFDVPAGAQVMLMVYTVNYIISEDQKL